jgi:2'-5' RNA ligase
MPDTVTLGVAIAIPEPHATVLTNWRRRVGDPASDLIWPHVTLLPPTPVPTEAMDDIHKHLASAAEDNDPFVMHLSGTGTFRPISPVVFIQIARGVSECELLEKVIRCGPLDRDLEYPYHPHVTVAQDVPAEQLDRIFADLAGFEARFPVVGFTLFEHCPAGHWRSHRDYVLTG